MGLFDRIFKNRPKEPKAYDGEFKLLSGYSPVFTRWGGNIYDSELVRAAIHARATHISKLDIVFSGAARPSLCRKLEKAPNQWQSWSQFLYRLSTMLDVHNTAFICPIFDEYGEVSGIYAPLPGRCEIAQYNGTPFLRYEFTYGERASIELSLCSIMTKMQYRNDMFGENNAALIPTMDLVKIQNQGIEEGVKAAATYRFMARVTNFTKSSDLANERRRFTEENFGKDAQGGGLLLFPNTYQEIKQIEAKPFVPAADQMKLIKDSVFEYFGVNEAILTNDFTAEKWSAFYEGAIEPWAVQFSQALTKMLFTLREQSQGNNVMATANRLQYMSNADKLNVSAQMADRGLMTRNEIRQIWNLSPLPEPYGSQLPARGEYYSINDDKEGDKPDENGNQNV